MSKFLSHNTKKNIILISLLTIIVIIYFAIILQDKLLQKSQAKLNYKIAILTANDMANRMQINQNEYIKGQTSFYVQPNNLQQKNLVDQHVNLSCDRELTGCKSYTTAANDLISWKKSLQENLINGNGKITFNPDLGIYLINVTWQDQDFSPKKSLEIHLATINQPWQHICNLKTQHTFSQDIINKQQKVQIIYDTIMGNKHNYNNFIFNAKIFTNYLEHMHNFDLKLANHFCDLSCEEYHTLNIIDNNLCDCTQIINHRAINFNCDNNHYAKTI
jgi:Tfp pilus assembly protein PilV